MCPGGGVGAGQAGRVVVPVGQGQRSKLLAASAGCLCFGPRRKNKDVYFNKRSLLCASSTLAYSESDVEKTRWLSSGVRLGSR